MSMNAIGGASTATAATPAAASQTFGERHELTKARYPATTSKSATLEPSNGTITTPHSAGAAAAASMFTPRARPKLTPAAFAERLRWQKSAPIAKVGNAKAMNASTA